MTAQLAHGPFEHHVPAAPNGTRVHPRQIPSSEHAGLYELRAYLAAHPPYIPHGGRLHDRLQLVSTQGREVAHLRQVRRIATRFPLCVLGDVVRELGQRFRRPDAHTALQADPLANAGPDLECPFGQVTRDTVTAGEGFID